MSNLVERLREQGAIHSRNCGSAIGPDYCVACAAASRIEKLEKALMEIASCGDPSFAIRARKALEE